MIGMGILRVIGNNIGHWTGPVHSNRAIAMNR